MSKVKYSLSFTCVVIILFMMGSCKFSRFVYYNFADIRDYRIFPTRVLEADSVFFSFVKPEEEDFPSLISIKEEDCFFENYLEGNHTVAFLIIQNDTVKYERYFDNYSASDIVPSFSMAKSITSILIGAAIADGLILSVDDPVVKYIPELSKNKGFEEIKITHLLQMTSGIKFSEGYYNPFGEVASFYYGRNLKKEMKKLKLKRKPGEAFEYISGNTAVLGWILDKVLKDKTLTEYLEEKLWRPLQMEYDATWSLDKKKGLEKAFCCINARAVDYAKIGRLYLHKGSWEGQQIVPESWVEQSTRIDTTEGSAWYYQNQWWLPSKNGDFLAQGILGQYIYVNPEKNLVIVRLGKKQGKVNWWQTFTTVAEYY